MNLFPFAPGRAVAVLALLPAIQTLPAPAAPEGRTWVVAQADPAATDNGPGDEARPFKSIAPAALAAGPGDTILVHAGIYRERVSPARGGEPGRPVTYLGAPGERVVVTGADLWAPAWKEEDGDPMVREALLDLPVTGTYNPFRTAYLMQPGRTLGQVFVDDAQYAEMPDRDSMRARPGTWWFDPGAGRLHVHFTGVAAEPFAPRVEITMRDRLFAPRKRGLGYIRVKGFVFERAANQFPLRFWLRDDFTTSYPQAGAVGTRSGHDWVIEDNVIRQAQNIGIDCGDEGGRDPEGSQPRPDNIGHHVIRGNIVSDNGCSGIMGWSSHGTVIAGNTIERNNTNGNTAPECAGVKMHDFDHGVITGNLIRDNDCAGIWLDVGYTGARVSRNLITGSKDMGIFLELGVGPALLDNNIVAETRGGDGVYLHDASGVRIAHNLLFGNAHFGVYAHVISDRVTGTPSHSFASSEGYARFIAESGPEEKGARSATSDVRVLNNLFIDNFTGTISLPPESPRSTGNLSDGNLFLTGTQSQWEREMFNHFRLNTNGRRIGRKEMAAIFRKADVPEESSLSFEEWRKVTGWDKNSAAQVIANKNRPNYMKGAGPEYSARFSSLGLFFEMRSGEAIQSMEVGAVEGVDRDYTGALMTGRSRVHPGPFQNIPAGAFRARLWPLPGARE